MLASIPFKDFNADVFTLFDDDWLLLTCGDFQSGKFNCMTISWGSLGTIWNRPFAQVAVRPTRFTFEFIERYPDFSLCAFSEEFRPALGILGAKSGRDGDKIKEAGLTPVASTLIGSPAFAEASLVIECRKLYAQTLDSQNFIDPGIINHYTNLDFHRFYFGEVLSIQGTIRYTRKSGGN